MGTPAIDWSSITSQYGAKPGQAEAPAPKDWGALTAQYGASQPEKPGAMERFWKATGIPDTARGLFADFGKDGDWDPGTIVGNATRMIGSGLAESGQHTVDAMDAASKGHFLEAGGRAVTAVPFVGPMIDQFATHVERGELPEAAGTALMLFGPSVLKGKGAAVAGAVKDAAPLVKAAAKGGLDGAMAPVPSHLGFDIPASVKGALGGGAVAELSHLGIPHGVGPVVGALAPAVKGAITGVRDALEARRTPGAGAPAPATAPTGPAWPASTILPPSARPGVIPITNTLADLADLKPAELKAALQAFMKDTRGSVRMPGSGTAVAPGANSLADLAEAAKGLASRRGGAGSAPEMLPPGDYFHGTSAPHFDQFKGDTAYLTPDPVEAGAFATNDIAGGGRGVGARRTMNVKPAEGSVRNIQKAIDEGMANDLDPDEVIQQEAAKARAEGVRYLRFDHPSSKGGAAPDFPAIVSLFPKDDLKLPAANSSELTSAIADRQAKIQQLERSSWNGASDAIRGHQYALDQMQARLMGVADPGTGTLADLANPKTMLEQGLEARRNAARDVKLDTAIKHLDKYSFTPEMLEGISPRQWAAVAQSAGINELSPTQIVELKRRFKESHK